jgi:SAM-dependent methyltransferase
MSTQPATPAYAIGQFRDAAGEVARLREQGRVIAAAEDAAFRELGFPDGGSMLDLGCGPGFVARRFLDPRPTLRITGVDIDRQALALARPTLPVAAAAGGALPFRDAVFDGAFARLVLRYLPAPERALSELCRVTRPGGAVFVLDADHGALVVHPEPAGFARTLAAREASLRRRGSDPLFARRLVELFERQPLERVAGRTLTVSTLAAGPAAFAALLLAPFAEAIDGDLMPEAEVRAAAEAIRAWGTLPGAFGMTSVVLVAGRRKSA